MVAGGVVVLTVVTLPVGLVSTPVQLVLVALLALGFAESIGLAFTLAALVAGIAGAPVVTTVLLSVLTVFALLESVVGFCAGCAVFRLLMRAGVIPAETCAECHDIWARYGRSAVSAP